MDIVDEIVIEYMREHESEKDLSVVEFYHKFEDLKKQINDDYKEHRH